MTGHGRASWQQGTALKSKQQSCTTQHGAHRPCTQAVRVHLSSLLLLTTSRGFTEMAAMTARSAKYWRCELRATLSALTKPNHMHICVLSLIPPSPTSSSSGISMTPQAHGFWDTPGVVVLAASNGPELDFTLSNCSLHHAVSVS